MTPAPPGGGRQASAKPSISNNTRSTEHSKPNPFPLDLSHGKDGLVERHRRVGQEAGGQVQLEVASSSS